MGSATMISTDFSLQRVGSFSFLLPRHLEYESQSPIMRVNDSLVTLGHFGRMPLTMSLMDSFVSATWSPSRFVHLIRKAFSVEMMIQ